MRRLGLLAIFIFLSLSLFAQSAKRIYKNPYVESQYKSQYGTDEVIGVIVSDATYILLQSITPREYSNLWISFSDNTVLFYQNQTLRIKYWGYWDGDSVEKKDFNRQYGLRADRRYNFVLVFPAIPSGVRKIDVVENVSGGFFWKGIHLSTSSEDREESSILNNGASGYEGRLSKESEYVERFNPTGSGTCFALNSQGYLVTCYHVVEGARAIKVRGVDSDFSILYNVEVVATDKKNDLAILRISDRRFTGVLNVPYRIKESIADVGENIFVLGYPLRPIMGDEIKLTNGIISSRSGYQGDITSYQITAAVQPGNSGGPLFDESGDVIGVINARLAVESASYAIKSPYLKRLSESSDMTVALSAESKLKDMPLKDKVKEINNCVYIIEVE